MENALDLARDIDHSYLEVRNLPKFTTMVTVRASVDLEKFCAVGQGDPGHTGYMRDRTFQKVKYKCFFDDEFFNILQERNDYDLCKTEVLMTGRIKFPRKVFICQFIWPSLNDYYDATSN